jgi:hypothetical protein
MLSRRLFAQCRGCFEVSQEQIDLLGSTNPQNWQMSFNILVNEIAKRYNHRQVLERNRRIARFCKLAVSRYHLPPSQILGELKDISTRNRVKAALKHELEEEKKPRFFHFKNVA